MTNETREDSRPLNQRQEGAVVRAGHGTVNKYNRITARGLAVKMDSAMDLRASIINKYMIFILYIL